MRSLLAQRFPVPGAAQANARRAAEIVAGADADLVVLPELWLSGYDLEHVHESAVDLDSPELAGRRVGPLICFDVEFPELARALARAGADLLVTASANMEPFYSDHQIASQARALDNRLPHLYRNRCGVEARLVFVGGSRAIGSDGTIAAEAGGGEELLRAEVGRAGTGDDRIDYLAQLREGSKQRRQSLR